MLFDLIDLLALFGVYAGIIFVWTFAARVFFETVTIYVFHMCLLRHPSSGLSRLCGAVAGVSLRPLQGGALLQQG